jgi:hypothetical protein
MTSSVSAHLSYFLFHSGTLCCLQLFQFYEIPMMCFMCVFVCESVLVCRILSLQMAIQNMQSIPCACVCLCFHTPMYCTHWVAVQPIGRCEYLV